MTGGLGPISRSRDDDPGKFKDKMNNQEPGYGRIVGANKDRFLKKDDGIIANMQCPASTCRQIRHIDVVPAHQDINDDVMASNIEEHAKCNDNSPYRCGTCRTPLIMYVTPQEKLHDREEI